jgi:hypothetical protein
MKELIKEYKKYTSKELSKSQWAKLEGHPSAGKMVRIYWKDGIIDYGYLLLLPERDENDFDYLIHVPKPDNSAGIGDAPPVWQHINNLLSNKLIKRVSVATRSLF